MRLNIEDEDMNSSKLKMAAALFDERVVKPKSEHTVLGMLGNLWYFAINSRKKELTIKEISQYIGIYSAHDLKEIIGILVECNYLEKSKDDLFLVLGKDKDYEIKEYYLEKSRVANEVKKERAKQKLLKISSHLKTPKSTKKPPKEPPVVPEEEPAVDPLVLPQMKPSEAPAMRPHYISSYISSSSYIKDPDLQTQVSESSSTEKVSTPEIINAAAQRQPAKPSAPFQIKLKFCDEYRKKTGEEYAWDEGKDFPNAKRLLNLENVNLEKVLNCVEKFFIWPNQQVIDAGYVFSDGFNSFYCRFKELLADLAYPERRVLAKASKIAFKQLEEKVKDEAHFENVMRKMEEQDAYANKN